ncbi:MAG TPA: 16S rRNA (cytidine(1402)-2'-O)-methyltransferase [Lentimicrobium sp.]|nr:16S rRNA (cytidine(1402)-2'-O)-methyltransferase [Lentimicrobium sp.]
MAKLYIVPTPVGNLEDMTLRAIRILKEANLVLAEDTRKTGMLLKHYDIQARMQSHHQHNEHQTAGIIAKRINAGETIALVTDAGTPGISDPGFLLIRTCIESGIEVECLPGATAFVPALVCSGLPCDRFYFEGFLPHKKGRNTRLSYLAELDQTIVLYESPFRLGKTLTHLSEALGGERRACVSREISKVFEEHRRNTLMELAEYYTKNEPKGEIVITIEGKH